MKNKKLLSIIISAVAVFVIGLSTGLALLLPSTKNKNINQNASIDASTDAVDEDVSNKGGVIYLSEGATYNMNSGTFEDFSQVYGGCVYVSSGSTFNMYEGTIKSGNAEYGGAIYIADGGTANIYAGSIESNKAVRNLETSTGGNGGAIYVANGGTLNLLGGTISGSEATLSGGAIYVEQGGTVVIGSSTAVQSVLPMSEGVTESVKLTGNSAENGGAIYFAEGANLVLNNCEISVNSANYGGGIYSNVDLLISEGVLINENHAIGGAGIYCNRETLTISGGTISNNVGQGVYSYYTTVTISGGEIKNNTDEGVYSQRGTLNVNGNAKITGNENRGIVSDFATLNIEGGEISGNKGGGIHSEYSTFNLKGGTISNNTTAENGGGVYLYEGSLNVTGGTISGNTAKSGGGVYLWSYGSLNMSAGTITGNTSTENGGGVYLWEPTTDGYGESSLTITGGTIEKNTTDGNGGGIYAPNNKNFSITGGTISENTAASFGGGIYFSCTYTGGGYNEDGFSSEFSNNKATEGGAIYLDSTLDQGSGVKFSVTSSSFTGNEAKIGGAIYLKSNSKGLDLHFDESVLFTKNTATDLGGAIYSIGATVNVKGATFGGSEENGNTAGNGGAMFITSGVLNMTSGTMSHNNATSGGAVYVGSTTPFNFSGGTISQNTAANGGGVYLTKGSAYNSQGILNLTETAQIISNTATSGGGGIYVNQGTANLTSGNIESNHALHGGGLCVNAGNAELEGTIFTSNDATNDGGAVFVYGGTATLSSGTISDNYANYGGAVCVRETGSFTMTNGSILNNFAKIAGGALRATDPTITFNLNGGTISDNYVDPNQSANSNQSWAHGGALWASNQATVNINGSIISNNYIVNASKLKSPYGGGIFISEQSTVNFKSGTIQGNLACASVSNNVVSFDSSNANSIGGNVFVSEDCYFNMTGGTLEGRKDNAGNYTYELQSQFGGGVGSMGITSLTGGTIRSCKAKHGGGVGSYGGIRVNNETLKVNIDLRANYLKIGSINILDCQAEEVGSSIAAGYEIEMFGSPNINGEISLSALEKAFLKLGFEISLLENDAKRYPEIYVSGSFNPAQQLKINFSQASIEAKVSLNSGSSYDYNLELTPGMMHDKFVDTEEQFVTYANGVSADPSDFYVTTNNGNTKYVVAKYVDALITNSTFNKDTKVYDTPSHTGNALILLSAFEISNMYVYTLTADQSAYTVGFGGENGIFTDYYDPNESVQTFAPKTATTTTNGFILNLPSTYDGKSVIGITDNGFKSARVASVVMPEGYIVIGEHAFDGCSSLTSVTIPSTIETVGVCAFMGCMNMAGTIDLSNAETIGNYAFYNCSSVTGTIDLSNVTTIGSRAFEGCSSLTGFDGTTSLGKTTTIGESAFKGLSNLTGTIDLTNVITVGAHAFNGCSGLTAFNSSSALTNATTIGDYAFSGCYNLSGTIDLTNAITIGDSAFSSCSSLSGFNLSTSLSKTTTIGDSAFYNCYNLNSEINLPLITSIDADAFFGCERITSLTLGENLTTIGEFAFGDTNRLATINYNSKSVTDLKESDSVFLSAGSVVSGITLNIGSSVEKIPAYLFYYESGSIYGGLTANIKTITFKSGSVCESVGEYAFSGLSNITSISFPSSLTTIGDHAFDGCTSLTSLTLRAGLTTLGNYAFANLTSLTTLNYNSTVMNDLTNTSFVFDYAGSGTSGVTINIASDVTKIPSYLFSTYHSSSLTKTAKFVGTIDLTNVTSVGSHAFEYCNGLTTLASGSLTKATTIGAYAFWQCQDLTGVLDLSSVITINNWAFKDCTKITSITIGENATYIGNNAFYNNSKVTTFNYNATNLGSLTSAQPGVSGSTNNCAITLSGTATFTIGANVERIPQNLFNPGNRYWGDGSVLNNGIKTIKINGNSTTPSMLSSLGGSLFNGCANVTGLFLPEYTSETLDITSNTLEHLKSLTTLNLGAVKDAQFERLDLSYVKSTLQSVTLGSGITYIPVSKFKEFTSLKNVWFDVDTIDSYAFYGCSNLNSVNYISQTKSIGAYAFAYTKLGGYQVISNKTEYIGDCAFYETYDFTFNLSNDQTSGRVGYTDFELLEKMDSGDFSQIWNLKTGSYNNGSGTWTAHSVTYAGRTQFQVTIKGHNVAFKNGDPVTGIINPAISASPVTTAVSTVINNNILSWPKLTMIVKEEKPPANIVQMIGNWLGGEWFRDVTCTNICGQSVNIQLANATSFNFSTLFQNAGINNYNGIVQLAFGSYDDYNNTVKKTTPNTTALQGSNFSNWVSGLDYKIKADTNIWVIMSYS